jgi:hypothetical protein
MQIEVTTDSNVDGSGELTSQVDADVTAALLRFRDRLTRVEVHLGDENSHKGGTNDKRCMIEARPAGQQPVAVTSHGDTIEEAYSGALRKLTSLLDSRFGKLDNRKGGDTIRRADHS